MISDPDLTYAFGDIEIQHCPLWFLDNEVSSSSIEDFKLWQWHKGGALVITLSEYWDADYDQMKAFDIFNSVSAEIKRNKEGEQG